MTVTRAASTLIAIALTVGTTQAQQPRQEYRPLIQAGGEVYDVPHIDFATPLDMTYRVAFDVSQRESSATAVNENLDSVARFLNLHAKAGVLASQLQLAVVIHGGAVRDLLTNAEYRERTGENNPNAALIDELAKAGVQILVCGQSAAGGGYTKEMFLEPVDVALSAMTAFAVLQERGYHVNPF